MNTTPAALLEAARRALRDAVRPVLADEHARTQLAAVDDILSKLQRMTAWQPALEREEGDALREGEAQFTERALALGFAPPAPIDAGAADASQQRARQLSDWLYDSVPAGAARDELDALLRAALRQAVAAERRHIPRTDFSAMTGSKDD